MILSAILPGAGQVYNGDYLKGSVLVFIVLAVFYLGGITSLTFALALFIWVYGIMDAYMRSARRFI